jgi:hypothetical protein
MMEQQTKIEPVLTGTFIGAVGAIIDSSGGAEMIGTQSQILRLKQSQR